MNWKRRYRRLEQRVLLDAAGAVTVAETDADNTPEAVREAAREALQQEQDDLTSLIAALGESRDNADTGPPAPAERHEILFIDDQLSDIDQLLDNLSDDVEVYHIEPDEDGIAFIADVLANSEKIYDAVHIVSHGDSGELRLGNAILTRANLAGETLLHIQSWGESIADEGDILIYGCRVAEGDSGESLVKAISVLTGADIAASTDDTGAAAMGGDWDFEVSAGDVEADIAFPENTRVQWGHLFAPDPPTDSGADNQPTLTPATATVTEDTAVDENGNLAATGTLSSAGTDNTQFKPENIIGAHGVLDIDADGGWSYKAPNGQTEIQELNSGESLTDTLTVTSADTVTTTVTITILGVNEATAPDPAAPGTTRQPGPTQQPSRTDPNQQPAPNQQNGNPDDQQPANPDGQQNANPAAPDGPTAQQDANRAPTANDDTGAGDATSLLTVRAADTGINAGLLVNDNDPDGDSLTISRVGGTEATLGAHVGTGIFGSGNKGIFTIRADGTYFFDPNGDFDDLAVGASAVASAAYEVSDGKGGTDVATLRVTVTAAAPNRAPVTVADTGATDADTTLTVNAAAGVLANDSDPDNDNLSIFQVGSSATTREIENVGKATTGSNGGDFTVSVDGSWTFDPGTSFGNLATGSTRTTTIYYLVSDGTVGTASELTVTVTGTAPNQAPTATDDTGTTDEDTVLTVANDAPGTTTDGTTNNADLLLNDTDPNGATLTISEVAGSTANLGKATDGSNGGSFTIEANGAYSFNPGTDFNGLKSGATATTSIAYTVTDGSLTDTATLTVTVTGADDMPTLALSVGLLTEDSGVDDSGNLVATGRVPISGGDTGEDKVTAATLTGSYGNLVVLSDGSWTYTADNSQKDIQQLADGATLSEAFVVTSSDTVTTGSVRIRINGADDATIATGTLTATLTEDVANEAGNLRTQDFTITFSGGDLNERYGFSQAFAPTNAPFGAALNLSELTTPANTATWYFDVANDDPGVQAIGPGESLVLTYTVLLADGSTRIPFTVTIIGADDTPTLTSATGAVTEDVAADDDGNLVATGTVTATGGDASDRRFIAGSQTGNYGELMLAANGAWTYKADNSDPDIQGLKATDSPTDTFTVTSADKVSTTSVTITINGANDAPTAVNDLGATDQNTSLTVANNAPGTTSGSITVNADLLLNDSDPDGDTLTIAEVDGAVANLAKAIDGSNGGEFTISADGSYVFNPDGDFDDLAAGASATTSIAYTVSDPGGATDTATLTVTVTRPNRAPVATPDQGATTENAIINVANDATADLLLNDTDPDGDTLTITGVSGFTAPAQDGTRQPQSVAAGAVTQGSKGGSFTLSANGAWRFDPGTDFDGLAKGETRDTQVTYTVSDGSLTTTLTDTATLTITVTGTDDVPTLTAATATLTEDTALTDGNLVAGGTVGSSGGDSGESGFQPQTAIEGTVGSFTITAAGAWTYTAANSHADIQALGATESITDTFIVTSADTVTTTSVTITINGANDAPIATDDAGTAIGDRTTTVANDAPGATITNDDSSTTTINADLLLNDSDPDGDSPLTISKVGVTITGQTLANLGKATAGSNGGEFTINADGSYTFDPDGDFNDLAAGKSRTTSVIYTVTDPHGGTDTATLTITVTPPVAPGATDDAGATTENTELTVAAGDTGTTRTVTDGDKTSTLIENAGLLQNDSHPNDATLIITNFAGDALVSAGGTTTGTGGGSFTVNADGSYTFDPGTAFDDLAKGATRTTSVAYTLSGGGATDRGTLTVTVTGVNDAPTAADDTGAAGNLKRQVIADGDPGTTTDGPGSGGGAQKATNADLLLNDRDPDTADTLSISAAGSSATDQAAANLGKAIAGSDGGLFLIRADGSWNFNHNNAFTDLALGASRTTSAVYTITDGNGGTSTATVTVTVTGEIQRLVARDDYGTATEGFGLCVRQGWRCGHHPHHRPGRRQRHHHRERRPAAERLRPRRRHPHRHQGSRLHRRW